MHPGGDPEHRTLTIPIANLALALFSIVLTLSAIEFALRLLHPIRYAIEKNMYYIADPFTGYRLAPFGKGQFADGIPADANLHGHRSDDVSLFKETGVFRILVLGDSFTVGTSIEQSHTYPSQLQRLLRRKTQHRVEVLNAGVGGWGPFQYAQYFAHYGLEFDPDLVIVGFFVGNDISRSVESIERLNTARMGRRLSVEASRAPLIGLKVALHESSHLARLVFHSERPLFHIDRESCDEFPTEYIQLQRYRSNIYRTDWRQHQKLTRVTRQIARIERLASDAGIPMVVVLIPGETQINPALPPLVFIHDVPIDLDQPQRLLEERFANHGIETIDLLPAFRANPHCLYQNDSHWTAGGHQLAAREIYRAIASRVGPGKGRVFR
jgi:hypothetical protein